MSEPPAPTQRMISGSDRTPLAIQDHGGPEGAPTVLLVHGYPDDHHVWDLVVPNLIDTHRVHTFDVRGAGASAAPAHRTGYRLDRLVADIGVVSDRVSPDAPVHLVGHDWGSIQCWSAALDPRVGPRIASFTSMSGPSLDHVARWSRSRRRPGGGNWRDLLRQGSSSWYIQAFHTPLAPLFWRTVLARRWPDLLRRDPSIRTDEHWPGPTLTRDAVNGIELYRANMLPALRRPTSDRTSVPVQLVIARNDPFVTPALLDGIEDLAPNLLRVELDAGHWSPRSHPEDVATLVAEHIGRNRNEPTRSTSCPA